MDKNTQAVSQQSTIELPSFTDVIKIEVEVNDIFNKLLSEFPEENKHRELISHAIIGSSISNGNITYVYNALNGYSPLIDFQVGDLVQCTEQERNVRYDANKKKIIDGILEPIPYEVVDEDSYKPKLTNDDVIIGVCEVVAIDLYSDKKLKVSFKQDHKWNQGETVVEEMWVSHKNCNKWSTKPVQVFAGKH